MFSEITQAGASQGTQDAPLLHNLNAEQLAAVTLPA